jgi:hypothetical protein
LISLNDLGETIIYNIDNNIVFMPKEVKKVYKFKDDVMTVSEAECHSRQMPLSSTYIAPYWFQAIQNVFKYEKARELREVHKMVSDDRIKRGHELYQNKHIKTNTVTTVHGGDAHATVLSSNKKEEYTVIVKNYLPEKLPQYLHEREEYWANLFIDCSCKDFSMGKFRDNASVVCIHVASVLWFLQEKFNMPRIFILPEQRLVGYKKSDVEELETNIQAMPLVKYSNYINIILLKQFRAMEPAISISLHRTSNETHQETGNPFWLTYYDTDEVEKLIRGITKGYTAMMQAKRISDEEIDEKLRILTMRMNKKKSWFDRLRGKV